MINITKKELEIDNELKKKIEFICSFCNILTKLKIFKRKSKLEMIKLKPYNII